MSETMTTHGLADWAEEQIQRGVRQYDDILRDVIRKLRGGDPKKYAVAGKRACYVSPDKALQPENVFRLVAQHYGVRYDDLIGPRRWKGLAYVRHVAIYMARHSTSATLAVIGMACGGRDHATALSAVNKITAMREADPRVARDLDEIGAELNKEAVC